MTIIGVVEGETYQSSPSNPGAFILTRVCFVHSFKNCDSKYQNGSFPFLFIFSWIPLNIRSKISGTAHISVGCSTLQSPEHPCNNQNTVRYKNKLMIFIRSLKMEYIRADVHKNMLYFKSKQQTYNSLSNLNNKSTNYLFYFGGFISQCIGGWVT